MSVLHRLQSPRDSRRGCKVQAFRKPWPQAREGQSPQSDWGRQTLRRPDTSQPVHQKPQIPERARRHPDQAHEQSQRSDRNTTPCRRPEQASPLGPWKMPVNASGQMRGSASQDSCAAPTCPSRARTEPAGPVVAETFRSWPAHRAKTLNQHHCRSHQPCAHQRRKSARGRRLSGG